MHKLTEGKRDDGKSVAVWMHRCNCNVHWYGTFCLEIDFATINSGSLFGTGNEQKHTHGTPSEEREREMESEASEKKQTAYNDLTHLSV